MARRRSGTTRWGRSTARPGRRWSTKHTITLPGGLKVNVNRNSVSVSGRRGPLSGTASSTGRRTTTLRLPGGFSMRKSF